MLVNPGSLVLYSKEANASFFCHAFLIHKILNTMNRTFDSLYLV